MGFIDWIKGAGGWISNNVVKPALSGVSWLKNNKFVQAGLGVAQALGQYSGTVGKVANIAQHVLDKGDEMNQVFTSHGGNLAKTVGHYYKGGLTPAGQGLLNIRGVG